eukprot:1495780-Pyramimonas_sp.AAC.1
MAVSRHSSTASRLSHRLLCSFAVHFELTLESFDLPAGPEGLRGSCEGQGARPRREGSTSSMVSPAGEYLATLGGTCHRAR